MVIKAIGGILVALGVVDLVGSFMEFDLWQTFGITLEGFFYQYSAMALILIGGILWSVGSKDDDEGGEEEAKGDTPSKD